MAGPLVTPQGLIPEVPEVVVFTPAQWAIAGGDPDTIECSYPTQVGVLYDGLILAFRAAADNATTIPTFSPDGLDEKVIVKNSGALEVGDIVEDGEYLVRYNLANEKWVLLNP